MAALLRIVLPRKSMAASLTKGLRAGFCSAVVPGPPPPPPPPQGEQHYAPPEYQEPPPEYQEECEQYATPAQAEQFVGYQGQYAPSEYQGSAQQYEQYVPPPPPPPKPKFNNTNVPVSLVCLGRAMQLKFQSQKEFEQMLDKASAFGVMLPDEPGNITRELCELDPKKVYVVVDMKAALKYTKKLAMEEAEKEGYPKDFMNFLNRNKYGKYESDDDC